MNLKRLSSSGIIVFLVGVLALWYFGRIVSLEQSQIEHWFSGIHPLIAGFLFIALYVGVTFFIWLSKDLFWLVGALLFGAWYSAVLIWISEIINALILFSLSRNLGRGFVEQYSRGRLGDLDKKLSQLDLGWLFLLRAVPLFSFRFIDMAFGLTGISFSRYMAAVILGTPFKVFCVQYLLAGVGKNIFTQPQAVVDYFLSNKGALYFTLAYLVLFIFVLARFKRKVK